VRLILWPGKLGRWGFFGRFFLAIGLTILILLPFKDSVEAFVVFVPLLLTGLLADPILARCRDIGLKGRALFVPLGLVLVGMGIQLALPAYEKQGRTLSAIVLVVIWRLYPDSASMLQSVWLKTRALLSRKDAHKKEDRTHG
jgi:hypothetical protein